MEERYAIKPVLESGLYDVRSALEKAWYLSNQGEDYFDLREEAPLQGREAEVVLLGYAGAALEHEMVHDYVTHALSRIKELEHNLSRASDTGGEGGIG